MVIKNTIPSCLGILASGSPSVPFDMTGAGTDGDWWLLELVVDSVLVLKGCCC